MQFSRGQTQVIYQFLPGAVFEHDRYGFCTVVTAELRETTVNQAALFDAMGDALDQWPTDDFRPGFPDPRDERNRRNYVMGTPTVVRFKPYPTILECRGCSRVYRLRDLTRGRGTNPGQCPTCRSTLGQLRYVQAHNCGRIQELYYQTCPHHGSSHVTFLDTGRVRSARWRCGACGGAEIGRLRAAPCNCAYTTSSPRLSTYERLMKTLPLTDSALFLPHVLAFINFNEEQQQQFRDHELLELVLARTWGIITRPLPEIVGERKQQRDRSVQSTNVEDMSAELVEALERIDPNHPAVRKWRESRNSRALPGEIAVQRVRTLLGAELMAGEPPARQLLENVAIQDTLSSITIETAAAWMNARGDRTGADSITQASVDAAQLWSFREIRVVNDFPIALCAMGFTRITRDPGRSVLSPFQTSDQDGRIPLYVIAAETEGIYFQLDPVRVSAWLVRNRFTSGPSPVDAEAAWAWLYRLAPGTRQHRWQPQYADSAAVAIRTLIHTMSHVLLRHLEWSGFSQNSIGEYLLPASLSFVLYANRYAETKIGGLTTLFEQRLGIWLRDSVQLGRECVYDPFCSDEGGTCVGCLHREYNCPQFNRELSRAVLYGGPTPAAESAGTLATITINSGFWDAPAAG